MRIKIFSTTTNNISSLEDQVNAWISVNTEFIIKDIKVAFDNNNILMTILHSVPVGSQSSKGFYQVGNTSQNNLPQRIEVEKGVEEAKPNFQEMLSVFSKNRMDNSPPESTRNPANTDVPTNNMIGGMQDISPSSLKPGRLIQNNYTKYTKTNQKSSQDQAFDWD